MQIKKSDREGVKSTAQALKRLPEMVTRRQTLRAPSMGYVRICPFQELVMPPVYWWS